ncbi:hypothetical protein AHiyo8_49510 [Arthrobacter sp. Hiyo8]|nr:hypothetical protein AHiyo8_49510 [Arthrobacter sp. Hiyo8]GAP57352.1 hypothetical protein AHiyo1_01870 [Arthrobacter sp. Hiyo1]
MRAAWRIRALCISSTVVLSSESAAARAARMFLSSILKHGAQEELESETPWHAMTPAGPVTGPIGCRETRLQAPASTT